MKYYLTQLGRSLLETKSVEDMRAERDDDEARKKMKAGQKLTVGQQRTKIKRATAKQAKKDAEPSLFNRPSVEDVRAGIDAKKAAAEAGGQSTSGPESDKQAAVRANRADAKLPGRKP